MSARDLTGLPESGAPLTFVPVAEILIDWPATPDQVHTPMRPKGMSARRYRETYDSTPHVVVAWNDQGAPIARWKVAGAVSAAVIARGGKWDSRVSIWPQHAAPNRETLQRMRAYDGAIVEVPRGCSPRC